VIPVVLAITGRWRAFGGAAATVIVLACAATALFGLGIWPAFLDSTHFTRTVVLEQGGTGFYKIQSVFAWARLWGGSVTLAYAAQFVLTALVVLGLARLWRSAAPAGYKGAALCLGALLATPYSLDYDLMLLAPAIALLASEGRVGKFAPWEASLLALLWLLPAAAREITRVTYLPLAVLAMLACFALTLRRGGSATVP
jgi:alpha-1,2-mannosyltransferase